MDRGGWRATVHRVTELEMTHIPNKSKSDLRNQCCGVQLEKKMKHFFNRKSTVSNMSNFPRKFLKY